MNYQPLTFDCRKPLLALFVIALFAVQVGCAPFQGPVVEPPVPTGPSYKVILATGQKQPEVYVGGLGNGLTVQDALKASGALSKFKGMRVDLARRVESGQVLKLPVLFDGETMTVLAEQNYAIHEGDEVLVRRDDPGMFSAMFDGLKGPQF